MLMCSINTILSGTIYMLLLRASTAFSTYYSKLLLRQGSSLRVSTSNTNGFATMTTESASIKYPVDIWTELM